MKNNGFSWSQASYFHSFSACLNSSPSRAHFFMLVVDFYHPLASIWVPMGSLFGTVFSTLFLNVEMVAKMVPSGVCSREGRPSKIRVSPPLGLSPSHNYP